MMIVLMVIEEYQINFRLFLVMNVSFDDDDDHLEIFLQKEKKNFSTHY